jgi:hypothetical protein
MTRIFKLLLILILVISITLIYVAVFNKDLLKDSDIQTVVGCLAVIAAIFSTWGALRVIDLAIENNRPLISINANFDRHILIQIELKNVGKTIAQEVKFKWENPPKDEGKDDVFPESEIIKYIAPGEVVIRNLGRGFAFPEGYNLVFSGIVTYKDLKKRKYREPVVIDLSKYMSSMTIRSKKDNMYIELTKLPDKIESLERIIMNKNFFVRVDNKKIKRIKGKSKKWPD